MKCLSVAQGLSMFLLPLVLDAKGLQLSPEALAREVGKIDRILQSTHEQKEITSPPKLSSTLLLRRIYLSAA